MGTTWDNTVYKHNHTAQYNVMLSHVNMIIINTLANLDFRGTYSVNRPLTFFPPMVFGVSIKRTASFPKHSLISSRKRSTKNDMERLKYNVQTSVINLL